MRVEQLIGNYTALQNRQHGKSGRHGSHSASDGKPHAAVLDMVCISTEDAEEDLEWFGAYVRQLPNDAVTEKIREIFRLPSASDDFLVEKLMFEVF